MILSWGIKSTKLKVQGLIIINIGTINSRVVTKKERVEPPHLHQTRPDVASGVRHADSPLFSFSIRADSGRNQPIRFNSTLIPAKTAANTAAEMAASHHSSTSCGLVKKKKKNKEEEDEKTQRNG